MIWFRRFLTIPLILIFVVLLVLTVVVTAVNNTAANPKFYNDQMKQADVYNYIYTSIVPAALDEVKTNQSSDLTINISDFKTEITAAMEQTLPPVWLQTQFEAATSTLIPYVVDDKAGFTYTIVFKDRVEALGAALKENILNSSAFSQLYDAIMPFMAQKLYDSFGSVASQAGITKQKIEDGLRLAVTQDWLRPQVARVIDAVVPYMTGESNSFSVNVPVQNVLNDSVILKVLGPANAKYLENVKEVLAGGLTFTDQDIRDQLGTDGQKTLDKVRGWIINGYIFTQDDLRSKLFNNSDGLKSFDDGRHIVSEVRTWLWVLWVISFIILICIGFLGGRGWKTRAAGPLVILLVVSLVIFFSAMQAWSQFGEKQINKAFDNELAKQTQTLDIVLWEKADNVAVNAAGDFAHNIENMGLYMAIVSGVGLVGICTWWVVGSRNKKGGSPKSSKPGGKEMIKGVKCPICGSETIMRTAKEGPNTGSRFYVCNRYPECKGKVPESGL